ncbi:hypothetical protein [Nocardioides sp.]|uniref:hypothetical protein n=1 Tax=Nocardioides sp. TaxID=35761 RepID=UPI0035B02BD3
MATTAPPNPPTNTQVAALLAELKRIADALNNPRPVALSDEAPAASAASNLDYLVLRQLMGRIPRDGEDVKVFPAARKRGSGGPTATAILSLGPVPEDADEVAVFTRRGEPAEVVPLSTYSPRVAKSGVTSPTDFPLTTVTNEQVITRLEFRRGGDHYPLALGPRLPVV